MKQLSTEVKNCARCGEDHTLEYAKLGRPIGPYTHWGTCGKTGEPVLITMGNYTPVDLRSLEAEVIEWRERCCPPSAAWQQLLGVVEEGGELAEAVMMNGLFTHIGKICHAEAKSSQGYRTGEDHSAAKRDGAADLVIFLFSYCALSGFSLADAIEETWAEVKQRDWVSYPETGKPPAGE